MGFKLVIPQKWAGIRTEPAASVPIPKRLPPLPIKLPSPPELPPGPSCGLRQFLVSPKIGLPQPQLGNLN